MADGGRSDEASSLLPRNSLALLSLLSAVAAVASSVRISRLPRPKRLDGLLFSQGFSLFGNLELSFSLLHRPRPSSPSSNERVLPRTPSECITLHVLHSASPASGSQGRESEVIIEVLFKRLLHINGASRHAPRSPMTMTTPRAHAPHTSQVRVSASAFRPRQRIDHVCVSSRVSTRK